VPTNKRRNLGGWFRRRCHCITISIA
jgi:hypothetical protein